MLPKVLAITPLTAVTTLKLGTNTSIVDTNLQLAIVGQLQKIVNRLIDNNRLQEEKINRIGAVKVKLPLIKRFLGEKLKLKGFLTQMYFKIIQEGLKLAITLDQVAYAGLFLTGRALEQFKSYLTKIQVNRITTTNQDMRYIFAS